MRRNPLWLAVAGVLLAACAGTPNPVLYPNAHLQTVGSAAAERDIAQCRQLASTSGVAEQRSGQVGSNAATGAAVGGASAGAWGLVRGNAALRGRVTAFNPKPGDAFYVTVRGTTPVRR